MRKLLVVLVVGITPFFGVVSMIGFLLAGVLGDYVAATITGSEK